MLLWIIMNITYYYYIIIIHIMNYSLLLWILHIAIWYGMENTMQETMNWHELFAI